MSCVPLYQLAQDTRLSNTQYRIAILIDAGITLRADLAKAANVSAPTVARAIAALVKIGVVSRFLEPGKPSRLFLTSRITDDTTDEVARIADDAPSTETRITHDKATRINQRARITHDTTTRITSDATPVDNYAPGIKHAPTRVEDNLLTSKNLELYSERVELAVTVPAKVLNGSARGLPAQRLAEVLADHANNPFLDPSKYDGLRTTCGRIHRWMTAGADFDADILPTVVRIMAKASKPVRSWGYFEDAVREATATRLASEAPMEIITPSEAMNDQRNRYPSDEGTYTRRKRSRHIDALFADESDGPPKHLGRLDFSSGK